MNFNNSRLVDHKPMRFGTFVPYMYRFVIIVKYLTNFFKLEWNLGMKFTLRFFFLSVYNMTIPLLRQYGCAGWSAPSILYNGLLNVFLVYPANTSQLRLNVATTPFRRHSTSNLHWYDVMCLLIIVSCNVAQRVRKLKKKKKKKKRKNET